MKLTNRNILIALFCASYIGSIVCNFYFLRKIDRNYSDLFDRSVPALSQLNKVTASAAYAMHQTYPGLFDKNAPGRASAVQKAREALATATICRIIFLKAEFARLEENDMMELKAAGEGFSSIGNQVVNLYNEEHLADANQVREREFRPTLERYIAVTKLIADKITKIGDQTNDQLTAKTRRTSLALLGLAGWPVMALSVVFLVLFTLGLVLLLLFLKFSWDIKMRHRKNAAN